jgi:predicted SnoaL-like aldol condensation-catalyzing enzyme
METTSYKNLAVSFLTFVINGKIDEAFEMYVDPTGKHHNAFSLAGFEELKKAMKENHAQFPNKKIQIKHVLGEGDMVATYSHLQFKADDPGVVVVHLFRFKEGKIVELWDSGQVIPVAIPNTDGVI